MGKIIKMEKESKETNPNNRRSKSDLALEIYKILNTKVNEEVNELYTLNGAFWLVTAALAAGFINFKDDLVTSALISIIGLLISYFWHKAIYGQTRWKNFWTYKLIDTEIYLRKENDGNIFFDKLDEYRKNKPHWKEFFKDNNDNFSRKGIWQELDHEKGGFGVTRYFILTTKIIIFFWLALFIDIFIPLSGILTLLYKTLY